MWTQAVSGALSLDTFALKTKNISDEDYNELKQKAAQSPESMLAVIESVVHKGVAIKQPDTIALLANFHYWMSRRELRERN